MSKKFLIAILSFGSILTLSSANLAIATSEPPDAPPVGTIVFAKPSPKNEPPQLDSNQIPSECGNLWSEGAQNAKTYLIGYGLYPSSKNLIEQNWEIHVPWRDVTLFRVANGGVCVRSEKISGAFIGQMLSFSVVGQDLIIRLHVQFGRYWQALLPEDAPDSQSTKVYFSLLHASSIAIPNVQLSGRLKLSQEIFKLPSDEALIIQPVEESNLD